MKNMLNRIFRTQPKKVETQVGVRFVSILFVVVVGLMVSGLAGELRTWLDPNIEVRISRVSHLLVAVFLTVLSFIGYFASQNRPQHRIYFFNLPLALFVLDVLMVFDYYIVLGLAESAAAIEPMSRADARPEAILVAIAFLLYFLWDLVSWRIGADPEYQKSIDGIVDDQFGARRWVTLLFLVTFSVIAIVTLRWNPNTDESVAWFDALLIGGLFVYRVAKPFFDPTVSTRHY